MLSGNSFIRKIYRIDPDLSTIRVHFIFNQKSFREEKKLFLRIYFKKSNLTHTWFSLFKHIKCKKETITIGFLLLYEHFAFQNTR